LPAKGFRRATVWPQVRVLPRRSRQGEGGPLRASYGSASQPAMIIGKDSCKADAVFAPN
jgi:hypothetical protein